MSSHPKVSVLVLTYNHEDLVADALDSALAQKTDFNYEIVIGDDHSTDQTTAILNQYKKRHPDKIRLLLQARNKGIRNNYFDTLKSCQGDYVAELHGDDYWTTTDKLQVISDFLDTHPECPMCIHNTRIVHQDGKFKPYNACPAGTKNLLSLEDLLITAKAFPSATTTRMRVAMAALDAPDIVLDDKTRAVLAARYGSVGYVDRVMAAWRVHDRGAFSQGRPTNTQNRIRVNKAFIEFHSVLNEYLEFKYHKVNSEQLTRLHYSLAKLYGIERHWKLARHHAYKGFTSARIPGKALTPSVLARSVLFSSRLLAEVIGRKMLRVVAQTDRP